MTMDEKITYTATLLDRTVSSEILTAYLEAAAEGILRKRYPFGSSGKEVPDQYSRLQCEIAAYLINKRGAEGQLSHNENGVSRSYEASYIPSSMLKWVLPYCEVL